MIVRCGSTGTIVRFGPLTSVTLAHLIRPSEISLEAGWSLSDALPFINTTIDREGITLNALKHLA